MIYTITALIKAVQYSFLINKKNNLFYIQLEDFLNQNVNAFVTDTKIIDEDQLCKNLFYNVISSEMGITDSDIEIIPGTFIKIEKEIEIETTLLKKSPICKKSGYKRKTQTKFAATMFADIRGFSKWSLEAKEREYEILLKHLLEIIVDLEQNSSKFDFWKIIGDCLMIVWLEPQNYEDIIYFIKQMIKKFNAKNRKSKFFSNLYLGIGLAFGDISECIIDFFINQLTYKDYYGVNVNIASRIQSLSKMNEVTAYFDKVDCKRNDFDIPYHKINLILLLKYLLKKGVRIHNFKLLKILL